MAAVSFSGLGSGIDINGLVNGLVNAQKAPYESRMTRKQGEITTDISAMGNLKSSLEEVYDALKDLNDVDNFQQRKATGRDDYIGISSEDTAEIGQYDITVERLAEAHKLLSASTFAEDEKLGKGSLEFTAGGSSFTVETDDDTTLADLKDLINDHASNKGVSASIITDASGQHLVLNATKTGEDNAIAVKATPDDPATSRLSEFDYTAHKLVTTNTFTGSEKVGEGTLDFTIDGETFSVSTTADTTLSDLKDLINDNSDNSGITASIVSDASGQKLVYTANRAGAGQEMTVTAQASATGRLAEFTSGSMTEESGAANLAMTELNKPTNAQIKIDGTVVVESNTNEFKDAIEGVTIEAKEVHESGEDSRLSITEDNSGAKTALSAFVDAYNSFSDIAKQLGGKTETGAGPLIGDGILRRVSSNLRTALTESFQTSTGELSLYQLGVTSEADNKLSFDSSAFDDTVEKSPQAVEEFFMGQSYTTSSGSKIETEGFAGKISEMLNGYTKSDGQIANRINTYNAQSDRITEDYEKFKEKMSSLQSRLLKQFNAMDSLVAGMNATGSYLQQQLSNLPGVVRKSK